MSENGVGFTLSYCGSLLAGAVRFMYYTTSGAGGWSISRSIRFFHVVPFDSPAFALLNMTIPANASAEDAQAVLDVTIQKIQWLMDEKKASPFDVDPDGNTLLHVSTHLDFLVAKLTTCTQKACNVFDVVYFYLIHRCNFAFHDQYFEFLQALRAMEIDLNRTNSSGLYVFLSLDRELVTNSKLRTCLNLLALKYVWSDGPGVYKCIRGSSEKTREINTAMILRMLDSGAEYLEVNPDLYSDWTPGAQQNLVFELAKAPKLARGISYHDWRLYLSSQD